MLDEIAVAVFLAMANERIVEYLFKPLKRRWPEVDMWWIPYVVLVTGFVIGYLSKINLFSQWISNPLLSQILTATVVGGGSELVHQIFGQVEASKDLKQMQIATYSTCDCSEDQSEM